MNLTTINTFLLTNSSPDTHKIHHLCLHPCFPNLLFNCKLYKQISKTVILKISDFLKVSNLYLIYLSLHPLPKSFFFWCSCGRSLYSNFIGNIHYFSCCCAVSQPWWIAQKAIINTIESSLFRRADQGFHLTLMEKGEGGTRQLAPEEWVSGVRRVVQVHPRNLPPWISPQYL